jgi:hypothetical protein
MSSYPFKNIIGIFLIFAFSLHGIAIEIGAAYFYAHGPVTDHVTQFEDHFDGIRKMLSPCATYEYIVDSPTNTPESTQYYFLTQYALAPTVIARNTDEPTPCNNDTINLGNGITLCKKGSQ